MADENDLGFLARLASYLGASENILRLIVSLIAGYPLALLHRKLCYGKSPALQHLYFIISGIALGYFNFGTDVIHSLINILLNYAVLLIWQGTRLSVGLSFVINMLYLCTGYYFNMAAGDYTVSWTTPHCVLTLRLIGLSFDCYDGKKKEGTLSAEQKETALKRVPSLLEVAGHAYFFGGFLVGPQFPMSRYLSFVKGAFADKVSGGPPASVKPAVSRLGGGIFYVILYQISSLFLSDSDLVSNDFQNHSLLLKCLIILIWGKLILYRYVGVWLITEGACILTGLTYNGKDENGNDLWNGCANIHVIDYEKGSTLKELVKSFNVNTNRWMAKYIYKRLKFLGSKYISQFSTLMFLAIWHGLYSGYFVNFSLEFFVMKLETELSIILCSLPAVQNIWYLPGGTFVFWMIKKTWCQFMLSYALVSFCLLTYSHYMQVYSSVLFILHVICLLWIPIYPYLRKVLINDSKSNGVNIKMETTERTKSD